MARKNRTHRNIPNLIGITLLILFLSSSKLSSQSTSFQQYEISELAISNIHNGIHSDNLGVKMNCIYFAGKYKILDVSRDLVEQIDISNDEELCQMMVWSLYQIGNDSCCEELQRVLKNHPSDKLKELCAYLHRIKEYQTAIAGN